MIIIFHKDFPVMLAGGSTMKRCGKSSFTPASSPAVLSKAKLRLCRTKTTRGFLNVPLTGRKLDRASSEQSLYIWNAFPTALPDSLVYYPNISELKTLRSTNRTSWSGRATSTGRSCRPPHTTHTALITLMHFALWHVLCLRRLHSSLSRHSGFSSIQHGCSLYVRAAGENK